MYSLHNVHLTLFLYVQSAQCTSNIMYSLHNVHLTLVLYVQSVHVQSAQCTSNISPVCTVCTMYI